MEKKSWPWKKKVFEKLSSSRNNGDEPQQVEDYSKQSTLDLMRSSKEQLGMLDGMSQTEIKLHILSEQLMARDELVQQHARVAEEAVAGWEKAECEAACLKQQLDEELHHKVVMKAQHIQVEKAFKGMLQHAEVSDIRLQKLLEGKSQELDSVRAEMQSTMSKLLSEMARAAKEAGARSQAEDNASVLQKRVDMMEKEQANLNYELHVLTKELDIRNEELEFSKEAAQNATQQHLENVKRAAKLEDDCQRLGLLLHKRTQGPALIARKEMEVEASRPTFLDKTSCSMSLSSRFGESCVESALSDALQELESRMVGIGEENMLLKEALTKKDEELQSARLLCVQTATKLSAAEEKIEKMIPPCTNAKFHRFTKSAMDGYTSSLIEQAFLFDQKDEIMENGDNSAESWASALITELAHIKKDKGTSFAYTNSCLPGANLMDDFAEMEKLALVNQDKVPAEEQKNGRQSNGIMVSEHNMMSLPQGVRSKLASLENELNTVKGENLAAKAAISTVEKHLVAILQAETEETASTMNIIEEVRTALDSMYKNLRYTNGPSYTCSSGMGSPEVRDSTAWSPMGESSCQSEDASLLKFSPKRAYAGQKLRMAVHKVVILFEEQARIDWRQDNFLDANDMLARIHVEKLWKTSEFECCVRSLILLCNEALDEKVDVSDFLEEIASALEWLVNHVYASSEKVPNAQRRLEFGGPEHELPTKQVLHLKFEDEDVSIENQLIQLKREKEDIDMKLRAKAKELEHLKSVLQNSDGVITPLTTLDRGVGKAITKLNEPQRIDNYHAAAGASKAQAHRYQNMVQPNGMCSSSVQQKQTLFAMVPGDQDSNMAIQEAAKSPDKEQEQEQEQELGGYGEKLVECQQAIALLGKQLQALGMPGHVSAALSKSEQFSTKPRKAHRRAQRSFDQLHTINEDSSSPYEERKIGQMHCDMILSYAMVSPEHHKECLCDSQRDLSSTRPPSKFSKSKSDVKDSYPEKPATGLSRFFCKSMLLNEPKP